MRKNEENFNVSNKLFYIPAGMFTTYTIYTGKNRGFEGFFGQKSAAGAVLGCIS